MAGVRAAILVGVGAVVCIIHTSSARSEELCAAGEPRAQPTGAAGVTTPCPADMVEIDGDFCPEVEQTCLRRPKEHSDRCLEFAATRCVTTTAEKKHFCVDTYEWPNKKGELPVVMKSWYDARDACKSVGKRLCTQDEWTLACEGPERLPYPYGKARDATACNIDRAHPTVDERALSNPGKRDAEVARLWQGEASGARERCVSPFGVHDMTGNVDEWTLNETGKPHSSALKGGYWSWIRARCRAVTSSHDESFRYYQIGFRCCAAAAAAAAPALAPEPEPEPAPAPAPEPAPAPPRPAPGQVEPPARGSIAIPAAASAHRVFLDGRPVGPHRPVIVVACGRHVVTLGHDGREQVLDVPCGGRVAAAYP